MRGLVLTLLVTAAFFAFTGNDVVVGQTPEPTATSVIDWPELTPTPVYGDPDDGSTVVWWWVLDHDAAPVGSWSSTVDITRRVNKRGGSPSSLYDPPGAPSYPTYVVVQPPTDTAAITMTCVGAAMVYEVEHAAAEVRMSTRTSVYVERTGEYSIRLDDNDNAVQESVITYRVKSGQSWPLDGIPTYNDAYLAAGRASGIQLYAGAITLAAESSHGAASGRTVCTVESIERFSGEVYVPDTPVVKDWNSSPWDNGLVSTPVAWTRVPTQTILTTIPNPTVVNTACVDLLPNWGWDEKTVGPVTIPAFGLPDAQICGNEYDFGLTFMGWDIAGLAMIAGMGGVVSAIYLMFKQGGG